MPDDELEELEDYEEIDECDDEDEELDDICDECGANLSDGEEHDPDCIDWEDEDE